MIEENFSLINTFLKVVQNSAILLLKVIFLFQNKCVFLTNGPSQTIIFYERIIQKGKKKGKFVSPLIQQTRIVRKEMYVIKFDQPTKIVA